MTVIVQHLPCNYCVSVTKFITLRLRCNPCYGFRRRR